MTEVIGRTRIGRVVLCGAFLFAGLVVLLGWLSAGDAELREAQPASRDLVVQDVANFERVKSPASATVFVTGQAYLTPRSEPTLIDIGEGDARHMPFLAGVVTRQSDGSRLAGDVVVLALGEPTPEGSERVLGAVSIDDGRFEFPPDVVAAGPVALDVQWFERIVFDKPYLLSQRTGRSVRRRVELGASLGPLCALDIRMDTGWTLTGRVVDRQGAPVSWAVIGTSAGWMANTTTDGTFFLKDRPCEPESQRFLFRSLIGEHLITGIAPPPPGVWQLHLGDVRVPDR